MAEPGWVQAPMWNEWLKLTRLQWSGRISFEAECDRWRSPFLTDLEGASVQISDCGGEYKTSLSNHIAAISDQSLFCSLILMRSYALLENHCKLIKHIIDTSGWSVLESGLSEEARESVDAIELKNGIESWAEDLITRTHQSWEQVYKGKAGLIEISIVRNALMHGYTHATGALLTKARNRDVLIPFSEGAEICVDFQLLHEYRGRIKSFCRILGDGVVHLSRGTHRSV